MDLLQYQDAFQHNMISEVKMLYGPVDSWPSMLMHSLSKWINGCTRQKSIFSYIGLCRFHSFSWHGTDPHNKTQMIPNAHQFQKLQIIPGNFYYNVSHTCWKMSYHLREPIILKNLHNLSCYYTIPWTENWYWLGNWKIFFWQSEITTAMLCPHEVWAEDGIFSLCRCLSCKSDDNCNRNI